MRFVLLAFLVAVGCGPASSRDPGVTDADTTVPPDACQGLECRIVNCEAQGKPPTTISGTVYAPNRTLPLYGVNVYIPLSDPGPLQDGVQCTTCQQGVPGGAVAQVMTDETGKFAITNAPSGLNVPLVIQIGKWRRQILLNTVTECTDNALTAEQTSLPRNKNEGDIPRIAVTTGSADAIECLVRKIGVADSEFTTDSGDGRVHMYAANGTNSFSGTGTTFSPASSLWGSLDKLKQYDVALFSCEGSDRPETKPQAYMDNVKAYADIGGRLFMEHYHNIWIDGAQGSSTQAPAVWPEIATCTIDGYDTTGTFVIDQVNNPKGTAFAEWMLNVGASNTLGYVSTVTDSRQSCSSVDHNRAERWLTFQDGGTEFPQVFQFTTPNEAAEGARCGKVVFSDMHVASGSFSGSSRPFPTGCSQAPMTPQEKALAFMFFDIATCVGPIF